MTRSSAEVEAEVEAQRGRLDATVEALRDKMTPSEIFDETAQALGGAGQQILTRFLEQAKQNPMPVALIGAGLVWMMMSSSKDSSAYGDGSWSAGSSSAGGGMGGRLSDMASGVGDRVSSAASKVGSQLSDRAHAMGDRAQDAASGVKHKVSDMTDQARESLQGMGEDLKGRGRALGNTARESRDWMTARAGALIDQEPLLLAGLGLAVGFAVGSALPSTSLEDQTLGHARDQLLEKGKDLASQALDQAGETAKSAYAAARDELKPGQHDGSESNADAQAEGRRETV